MPLYEFECEACEKRFERIQKFSDPNPETCPSCGKGPVRKLPSSPAIQFKGSGFYITDYAKKPTQEGGGKSSSGDKSSDSKSDSNKSDSKSSGDSGSTTASASTTSSDSETSFSDKKASSSDKKASSSDKKS
jgi:putative FmdB family regulatory protein